MGFDDYLTRRQEKALIDSLEHAGIYERFRPVTFDSIERRGLPDAEDIRRNYTAVKDYADNLKSNIAAGRGLILAGGPGTMKTTMAVAILRAQLDTGENGLFIPMCSLIDTLFTKRSADQGEWLSFDRRVRTTPLLVLDDLGGELNGQEWVLAKVDSIITERYNRLKPVIITTNLGKNKLADTYSARLIDRIRSTSKYLAFTGPSQRSYE